MTNTDLSTALESIQQEQQKVQRALNTFRDEIESDQFLQGVMNCTKSRDMWAYRDRIEEIKAGVYKMRRKVSRNYGQARDLYKDGMRSAMARAKNAGAMAYAEREAEYEIQNITEYKLMNTLERMKDDLDLFYYYLEGRLRWIVDRQRWLQHDEKML